jgi:hypothetical protein
MSRRIRSLVGVIAAVLALAGTTAWAAPAKAKAQSVIGTLQKVEGQTLTIETAKGSEKVTLSPTAQIHSGSKTLSASELSSQTGSRVKVRYSTTNGQKQAESVTVSSARPANQSARASTSSKGAARTTKK